MPDRIMGNNPLVNGNIHSGVLASRYDYAARMSSISEKLKELTKKHGYNFKSLSLAAGLGETAVRDIVVGRVRSPQTETLEKIANHLKIPLAEITGNGSNRIPVIGIVGAGGVVMPVDDLPLINPFHLSEKEAEELNCELVDSPPGVYPINIACVKVTGTSMYPRYMEGEYLFYKRTPRPAGDCLNLDCVVALADGRVMVKTLRKGSLYGTFTLDSYNQPPLFDQTIEWCAPVEWTHKKV